MDTDKLEKLLEQSLKDGSPDPVMGYVDTLENEDFEEFVEVLTNFKARNKAARQKEHEELEKKIGELEQENKQARKELHRIEEEKEEALFQREAAKLLGPSPDRVKFKVVWKAWRKHVIRATPKEAIRHPVRAWHLLRELSRKVIEDQPLSSDERIYLSQCLSKVIRGERDAGDAFNLTQSEGRPPKITRNQQIAVDFLRLRNAGRSKIAAIMELAGDYELSATTIEEIAYKYAKVAKQREEFVAWAIENSDKFE